MAFGPVKQMILLIKPEAAGSGFSLDMALKTEPLELEYLAAMLTARNFPFYIYEASFESQTFEEILSRYQPQAVAITGYITQEALMLRYARRAKAFSSDIVTIIGGSHAQLNYSRFCRPEVSYICRSDNIFALAELLEYEGLLPPANGMDPPTLSQIDGLCYRDAGQSWNVNDCLPFDINLLPLPDRSQFLKNRSHYRYLDAAPVALMKTSTSCPYQCSFCYGRLLNGQHYFRRNLESIVEEIASIPSDTIQIADDDFLFDEDRLWEFIRLIRCRSIHKTYICYGRSDFISSHPELMRELADIGVTYLMVGLEAVSDQTLDAYHKNTSVDHNLASIRLLRELKVNLVGLFIIDLWFRPRDFRAMRRFIHEQGLTYTGVSIFTPIPGTALFEEYKDRLITRNCEKWDFMHLVTAPVHISRFRFYLEYYLLVMDLFSIAQKAGIYCFLKLSDYKNIFLRLLFTDGLGKGK